MADSMTILNGKQDADNSSVLNPDIKQGDCFEEFVDSQKNKGVSDEDVTNLRAETQAILMHCNPHDAKDNEERTHLVIGYVQSGKTMSFMGLTALAHDNGYRVVVYFTGTKNNLRNQTTERIEHDLIKKRKIGGKSFKIHQDAKGENTEELVGHLNLSSKPTLLIPILKHYDHIQKLTEVFNSEDFKKAMGNETVLIVDDEADQASLNSYGRANSKKEEERRSSTYDAILKMRAALPGNTYIQYTATPQANLLISIHDLLSPDSHTLLTPGKGYIGGKQFFDIKNKNALFDGKLIVEIPQDEVFNSVRNNLDSIPNSLRIALRLHIIAVAIVVKIKAVEGVDFLTMMVHPDVKNESAQKFKKWIENELVLWRKLFDKPDGHEDKVRIINEFKQAYTNACELYPENECPSFEEVIDNIPDVLNDKKVYLVNSTKDANVEVNWEQFSMHILVGAEMLNRGFTVENLTTTYMTRQSLSKANADTIQQRCRFFGYKGKYIRSCRVFLPSESITNYVSYVEHEEELRNILSTCDKLDKVEHQIMLSDRLRPTRQNVLPESIVKNKLKGWKTLQSFDSEQIINHNKNVTINFLKSHEQDADKIYKYSTADRTHRRFKIQVDDIISYLKTFKFGNIEGIMINSETIRYLSYLSSQKKPLEYVYVVQMAYESVPRERSFNFEKKVLAKNTRLFAGPSSDGEKYPGDDKIREEKTLTIQIHHLKLKGVRLGFPEYAYTLAFHFPESLATSYFSNQEN